jgi:hypothetical protein
MHVHDAEVGRVELDSLEVPVAVAAAPTDHIGCGPHTGTQEDGRGGRGEAGTAATQAGSTQAGCLTNPHRGSDGVDWRWVGIGVG